MSFIFGGNTGITYEDLQRRRKSAQSVMDNQTQPTDFWSGLGAIGQAFIGRSARNKADKAIADRGMQFKDAISGAMAKDLGLDDRLRSLSGIASDPNFSQSQRDYAKSELDYWRGEDARKAQAGMNDLKAQNIQSQIDARSATPDRKVIKGADGFQYYQDTGERVLPNVEMQANSAGFGGTPIYGELDGNLVVGQLNDQGGVRWNNVSDDKQANVQVTRPIKTVDTGTGTAIVNSMTGGVQGEIGKNLAEAEGEKVTGKMEATAETQAKIDMPQVEANANEMIKTIDMALDHPGLDSAVGPIEGFNPGLSDETADFVRIAEQIQGKTFMEAYQGLKGGGQITEVEGKKAEAAIARLSRRQSEEGFKAALKELRGIVQKGVERARIKAGGSSEADIMAKYGVN